MAQTALDLTKPQPPAQPKEQKSFADLVRSKVSSVLVGKKSDDFVTALISLMNQDPALKNCMPMSLVSSALQAQSLNLSLNKALGQAWIVPFKDKKVKDINPATNEPFTMATFQIGYKGYVQLAIRSGQYRKLNVLAIKDGELRHYDPLNEELHIDMIQDDAERELAPTIGYYAMFEYLNGFRKTMYWSKAKMAAHADRFSQAFSLNAKGGQYPKVSFADFEAGKVKEADLWKYSSFWYKDFDGMAYKTMIRQILSKWGVMSVEMQQAYETDMRVINDNGDMGDVVDAEYSEGKAPLNLETVEAEVVSDTASPQSIPCPKADTASPTQNAKAEMDALRNATRELWESTGHTLEEAEKLTGLYLKQWSRATCTKVEGEARRLLAARPAPSAQTAPLDASTIQCPKVDALIDEMECASCHERDGCPAWE